MIRIILLLAAAPGTVTLAGASACLELAPTGDQILARDLAPAWPALRSLPGDAALGYMPAPGTRRVFRGSDLARLAARYQIAPPGSPLCVGHAMEPLTRARLLAAMRAALDLPEAQVGILEFSRFPAPRGELDFPLSGLARPASPSAGTAVLWKGSVRYQGRRRFAVWARVRISAPIAQVVAIENLPAGKPIRMAQLRVETRDGFPLLQPFARSLAQVADRLPRRAIAAGAPVPLFLLEEAPEVRRGDPVEVRVETGAARLSISGRAESSGRRGDRISVRNLSSGRTFSARVEDKDRVAVIVPGLRGTHP
ncbi:MAG TPA: flagellar basal body P-ring formation chaperone FlgA [Bryobacteraceae bacterium]|nr:flagellar basal body P-ring formation chaperone FlgA [Bryobacteraceae bacterium]